MKSRKYAINKWRKRFVCRDVIFIIYDKVLFSYCFSISIFAMGISQFLRSVIMKFQNMFDEIAEKYYKQIYIYCSARLEDEHAANDCVQEVFFILYKKINKLKLSENIRAWLYRTADNVMKNYKRKIIKEVPVDDKILDISQDENFYEGNDILELVGQENYNLLIAYYLNGSSIAELSKQLRISEEALHKRIQRLKKKIKDKLYDKDKT